MAVAAFAAALVGCTAQKTAQIAPTALPALAQSDRRAPNGWHETTAEDGDVLTLRGPISRIRVVSEGPDGTKVETFVAPFSAYISGPELYGVRSLVVTDEDHSESFAPGADTRVRVMVEYHDPVTARNHEGVYFLAAGTPLLGLFTACAVALADGPDEGAGGGYMFVAGVAVITGITGPILTGRGVHLLLTDPEAPKSEPQAVELRVGPTGATLQLTF